MLTYIAFGSNLGDRRHAIMEAAAALAEVIGPLTALSSLHDTEPVDMDSENRFLNAVAAYDTTLSPAQLLYVTQAIEQAMGRTEKSRPIVPAEGAEIANGTPQPVAMYHPDRIIDIDILAMGEIRREDGKLRLGDICINNEEVLEGQRLTLPHPHMLERPFVLDPLREILPPSTL